MRAARLATLALLFCQVGQDTISTFILSSSSRSVCRSRRVLQVGDQVSMRVWGCFIGPPYERCSRGLGSAEKNVMEISGPQDRRTFSGVTTSLDEPTW